MIMKRLSSGISNQSIHDSSFLQNAGLCSGDKVSSPPKAGDDHEDHERIQLRCFFRAGIEIRLGLSDVS